jgi:hypothetical protein
LNVRVAAVRDLPNLAYTRKRCWFAHDTNCGLTGPPVKAGLPPGALDTGWTGDRI